MTERLITRAASPRPTTANETTRTVELVVATEADVGDGLILSCRQLPEFGPAPVPVLLSHQNQTGAMAGRLRSLRVESGQVIGMAEFTDAPAADAGWQLARSGCAVSVGASIRPDAIQVQAGQEVATRWRLREASLVPVGADPFALTRSATSHTMTDSTVTITPDDSGAEQQLTREERKAQKIELAVRRAASSANLGEDVVQRVLSENAGRSEQDHLVAVVRELRLERERIAPVHAGHPARSGVLPLGYASPATRFDIGEVLSAKLGVTEGVDRSLAQLPMALALRDYLQNDPSSRGIDLMRSSTARLVDRAFSTSDFKIALESSAERALLQAYNDAQDGILSLASSRVLSDFRAIEFLRVSKFGDVPEKKQGGEYVASTFSEEDAGSLAAAEYGAIQSVTRRSIANDDLNIFGQLVAEMGRAAARKERSELASRLGDISWTAANSETADAATVAELTEAVVAAVLDLRRQTDVNGNPVSFNPTALICSPELEGATRQMLGAWSPTTSQDVRPFDALQLIIDANIGAKNLYLCDTNYPPLVIGRLGNGPVITTQEDFKTGDVSFRVQHDFGTAVLDARPIVKITTP